ncbi:hypothetical protein HK099_004557 [Clydaea vesicula]|uniref:Uncharacterized protein n=1 Tax=Clydaea vesicula TaxID=447962 RepID=A0AAD5XY59_9FUNG|nr:hypothetical protein HK099_004557 [Clydaea vesicula]
MKPRPLGLGLGATPAPFAMNGEKNFKGSELKNKNTEVEEKIEENKPRKKAAALTKYEEDQIELAKFKSGLKVFVKQGKFKNIIGKIVESKLIKNDGISVKLKIKKDLNGITDKEGEIIKVWSDQCQLEDENGDFKGKDATSSLKKVKTWVKPYIKVMITNKQFGKYYKCKGIVQDISSNGQFSLKIENGQLVEKLTDFDVESYIPSVGKPVLVLKCKLDKHIIGQTGKILEKNVVKEKCVVQLDRDFEIKTFDFDDISEIVEEEHFDFS